MNEIGIDYNKLFRHIENSRKVLLVAVGRSGSDFFQSLLDGHPEILQFTGSWFFHQWWNKEAQCKENLPDLIDEFIWHSCISCNHIAKFKSCYNTMERWDQLGINKDESFEVDMATFKKHMLEILTDKELSSKNFFLAVNLAYGLTLGIDISKIKIIFYHIHHIEKLKEFKTDFPSFEVICTVREPRNTLVSGMEHWKKNDLKTYNPNFFYQLLKRIVTEFEPVLQYTNNLKILKLEDLHLFPQEVLKDFCATFGLKFDQCMLESSYHGKKWWGDKLSDKYLDGFNKNIKKEIWRNKLFFYDNFLIEFILEDKLKHYGYTLEHRMPKSYLIFAFFLTLLPMKYELSILIHSFRVNQAINNRFLELNRSGFFYLKRISLYYKFTWKKICKKTFLASSLAGGNHEGNNYSSGNGFAFKENNRDQAQMYVRT